MSAADGTSLDGIAREVLDNLLEGCQLIGPDWTYRYVNAAAARQGHTTRESLVGRTMMEVYPGIEHTPMFAVLRECMAQRQTRQLDNEFLYPDGQRGWFELRLEPAMDGVLILSVEVTEQKRAQEALRRSNRALATLSECNQTLVRAQDEHLFLQDVCRIAVERGGYRMAWVGSKERDEARSIKTLSSAGMDAGYTESLQLTWDDSPRGRGPTGRAVRTEEIVVARTIATDPDFDPWRREAVARGYASSIALPYRIFGKVTGALTLYSSEPDAFDAQEVELLAELALDLGHGIQILRERSAAKQQLQERWLAEEALRASNERFNAFMDASPVLCCVNDDQGRYLYVNGAWEQMFGLKLADCIGKRAATFMPPAVAERIEASVRSVLQTGKPLSSVEGASEPGGKQRSWSTFRFPIRSASGQRLVGGVSIDISERMQAEEGVRRLNERLLRLAQAVQDLASARDGATSMAIVRSAARSLADADASTFVLRDGDQCHYVDEDSVAPLWKGQRFPMSSCISGWVMEHRQAVAIEDVYADPRISQELYRPTFVRSLVMIPIGREQPLGAIGIYWAKPHKATAEEIKILQALADATSVAIERVRMVEELKLSEDRFRSLVENLEDVVFSIDVQGIFQYVSPSIARYGYTPQQVLGGTFARYVHPDDIGELVRSLARILAGQPETRVFRVLDSQGAVHFVRTAARAVMSQGRAVGISGVLIDITELKHTEEQLRVAQKMEAVGQLAGGVAHDFNNLLAVILSYAGFISEAVHEADPIRADIEEVRKAGLRAAALTHQLLAFSRKQVLEPQILELNVLATDLEKMLRRVIGEDIELTQVLAPDLGRVKADPGQLQQVIMNLIVNARDAMPHGGKLTLETANVMLDEEHAARHASLHPGAFVMLAISDTGSGMDETTKQRLFEPFYTTKEIGRGTGLGLSTVYGIVQQSGGSVTAYSELGVGTTFKVYLPIVDDDTGTPSKARESTRPAVGNETILVVEDDQAVRNLTTRILRAAGYAVITAANGGEALLACEAHDGKIDLLVTDVVMPQMSGRQLAERLGQLKPNLRVLYMSGYTDNAIEHHGVLEPGTMFISKPFGAQDFTRKVRDVLDAE